MIAQIQSPARSAIVWSMDAPNNCGLGIFAASTVPAALRGGNSPLATQQKKLAPRRGFEPPTCRLGGGRSVRTELPGPGTVAGCHAARAAKRESRRRSRNCRATVTLPSCNPRQQPSRNRGPQPSRNRWPPHRQVAEAAAIASMESRRVAVNSASVWLTDRPSVSAREKLATMPRFSARRAQASARL